MARISDGSQGSFCGHAGDPDLMTVVAPKDRKLVFPAPAPPTLSLPAPCHLASGTATWPHVSRAYSITSSARTSSEGGTVRSNALAALRLMINCSLVGL